MTDEDIERLARDMAKERGLDPDQMMTSEKLYEIDGMVSMPTMEPFPAWKRYVRFAQDLIRVAERNGWKSA